MLPPLSPSADQALIVPRVLILLAPVPPTRSMLPPEALLVPAKVEPASAAKLAVSIVADLFVSLMSPPAMNTILPRIGSVVWIVPSLTSDVPILPAMIPVADTVAAVPNVTVPAPGLKLGAPGPKYEAVTLARGSTVVSNTDAKGMPDAVTEPSTTISPARRSTCAPVTAPLTVRVPFAAIPVFAVPPMTTPVATVNEPLSLRVKSVPALRACNV